MALKLLALEGPSRLSEEGVSPLYTRSYRILLCWKDKEVLGMDFPGRNWTDLVYTLVSATGDGTRRGLRVEPKRKYNISSISTKNSMHRNVGFGFRSNAAHHRGQGVG